MGYSTLMVHADLDTFGTSLLRVSADLAALFEARVVGVAACMPTLLNYGDQIISGDIVDQDRAEIDLEMNQAEAQFRAALQGSAADLEWRSTLGFVVLADYVVQQARAADLIITNPEPTRGLANNSRHVAVGELVMKAGRPVLVVPEGTGRLDLASVMVAWKDTRETRRAVVDALPLLQRAGRVAVVEVAAEDDLAEARAHLADVVAWLARHDVAAEAIAMASSGDDTTRLDSIARDHGAGLIVAGAFGHSRVREWVLGGVTRDLLRQPGRCALLSH